MNLTLSHPFATRYPAALQPTRLDLRVIQSLAPLEKSPHFVALVDVVSQSPLVNGLVYALTLSQVLLLGYRDQQFAALEAVINAMIATFIGSAGSVLLQRWVRRPAPGGMPDLAGVYAFRFREYFRVHPNPNSFPSDSAMLYSAIAFAMTPVSAPAGIALVLWLLGFVGPAKICVAGHYPTDILAGVVLGLLSYGLAVLVTPLLELPELSRSPLFGLLLFVWLFEVGNEFRDLRHVARGLLEIRRSQ